MKSSNFLSKIEIFIDPFVDQRGIICYTFIRRGGHMRNKIAWESWNEMIAETPSSPEPNSSSQTYYDEEGSASEVDPSMMAYLDNMYPAEKSIISTPFGMFYQESHLRPSQRWDCWMGYTNFDITPSVLAKIETVAGVEAIKVLGRYTFFVGIGKMFKFREVRSDIESMLTGEKTLSDPLTTSDPIMYNGVIDVDLGEVIEELSQYKHWAAYLSPEGSVDYIVSNEQDEDYTYGVSLLKEYHSIGGGEFLESGGDHNDRISEDGNQGN